MAFDFDIRTLFLAHSITTVVLTIAFITFWYHFRSISGPFYWAVSMAVISIGNLLVIARGHIPDFCSIVIANSLILAGFSFVLKGIRDFLDIKKGAVWEWLPVVIVFFHSCYYVFIRVDLIARIIVFSLAASFVVFRCAYLLYKNYKFGKAKFQGFTSAAFFIIAGVFFIRAVVTLLNIGVPESDSFLSFNSVTVVTEILGIAAYIALSIGLISLPGQRAMEELRLSSDLLTVANKDLMSSEERFRTLSEASFEGIIISEDGRILDVNNALVEMFGYDPIDFIGNQAKDFVVPEQQQEVLNRMMANIEEPYEINFVKKDGTVFPTEICCRRFTVNDRLVRVSAIRDLTERKKAEAEIKTLKGILPICANCKKIRDDKGYWSQVESYIKEYSEAEFSHSICPECAAKLYPGFDFDDA